MYRRESAKLAGSRGLYDAISTLKIRKEGNVKLDFKSVVFVFNIWIY